MKNNVSGQKGLGKDYVHASGMMLRVGKAVLGLVLFALTKMGKVFINKLDKTELPSSAGEGKKVIANDTVVRS